MEQETVASDFLACILKRFEGTKALGDKALAQIEPGDWCYQPDPESTSIAIIVQHLHGNMLSRWTDFLTTDGEKPTRQRDAEFELNAAHTPETLYRDWEAGWACVFAAIRALQPDDLRKTITIRGMPLIILDAILRQMEHYSYHVGQVVYLARHRRGAAWKSLSIPKGESKAYVSTAKD